MLTEVSFGVWPQAALVIFSWLGYWSLYNTSCLVRTRSCLVSVRCSRGSVRGFSRLFSQGKEGEPIEKGKIIMQRNRQQIIGKDKIVGGKEKENEKHA